MQHVNEADAEVDYTVIIPTYNGRRTIVACLASVVRALDGCRGEVIVVDSSTDDTAALVREHFPSLTLIRSEERLSAGGARNRGSAAARGRLVFFTDQDCVVPPDWIARMAAHFTDPVVDGLGGSIGIHNPSSASGSALYFLEFLNHFPGRGTLRPNEDFLVGCNAVYRAEVLRAVSFPDKTLGEDVLFGHALRKHGWRTFYDERIVVAHDNRSGWKTFFAYNVKMGRAAAAYHAVLRLGWATPFLRFPVLSFVAPFAVLPSIALDLLRSRPSYFLYFLLLLPMCFLGNVAWAAGFMKEGRSLRRSARSVAAPDRQSKVIRSDAVSAPVADRTQRPRRDSGINQF